MTTSTSIMRVTPETLERAAAFLDRFRETSLFLISSLREHGPALGPSINSANFRLITVGGRVRAVFGLTRRGNLLAQTDGAEDYSVQILDACAGDELPLNGVVAAWDIAEPIWRRLQERDAVFRPTYESKEILYRLDPAAYGPPSPLPAGVGVRAAERADFDHLDPLYCAYLREEGLPVQGTPAQRRARFDDQVDGGELWVLRHHEETAATAAYNARCGSLAQIGGVYTPPGQRRRGFARLVMEQLIADSVRVHGVDRLILFTGEENVAARALYEGLGFERFGHFGLLFGTRELREDT